MNTPARSRRRAPLTARRNLEGARSMHFRRLEAITRARNVPLMLAALTAASALLAAPAAHAAFLPLPATGVQVNDDPVNSIDPSEDAGVADVAGGTLTAGPRRPKHRRSTSPVRDARSRGSRGTSRTQPSGGRRTSSPAVSTRRPISGCPPARPAEATSRPSTSTFFARPRTPRSRAELPSRARIQFHGSPGRRTTASRMTARRGDRSSSRRA